MGIRLQEEGQTTLECNQPSRSTQPGHPSMGTCSEYQRKLGFTVTHSHVTTRSPPMAHFNENRLTEIHWGRKSSVSDHIKLLSVGLSEKWETIVLSEFVRECKMLYKKRQSCARHHTHQSSGTSLSIYKQPVCMVIQRNDQTGSRNIADPAHTRNDELAQVTDRYYRSARLRPKSVYDLDL